MWQLLSLLGALLTGYYFRHLPVKQILLNRVLFCILVLIIFMNGYEFGTTKANLLSALLIISKYVLVFGVLLFVFNLALSHYLLTKVNRELRIASTYPHKINYLRFIIESGKYALIIVLGIISGFVFKKPVASLGDFMTGLLLIMLFIVGHQLRLAGVAISHILFNRVAMILALTIGSSSLIAGLLGAVIFGMPLNHGLMLCSGFGWYSLSSILNGQLVDHDFGTISFFIDFSREFAALILIPSLGRYFPASMVGYCGGAAMDFGLPIIKENLHQKCVLLAISSGMLLSIATPILIALFAKL